MRRASGCSANAVTVRGRAAVVRRSSPSALNSKEAEQRTGDATLSDELHAEHREGRGDVEAERFWEDHYRRRERVWSGRPNAVLVDVAGSLQPGTALDLGCGEGGDAIWLAQQGWRVRAVDVSATALDRAAAEAATAGVVDRIDFHRPALWSSSSRAV